MSTRERWIVYPLLFLALGAALRDQFFPSRRMRPGLSVAELRGISIECEQLRCRGMVVVGGEGKPRVRLGTTERQAGQLEIYGNDNRMVVLAGSDTAGGSGLVETLGGGEKPTVRLAATGHGGEVTTFNRGGKVFVSLGYQTTGPGVFAAVPDAGRMMRLTNPWWTTPPAAKPQ